MNEPLSVIKIGGNVLDDPRQLKLFLEAFKHLPGRKILVHGGGKRASEISAKLGIRTHMIEGRRITDTATLEVVTMVYAGLINKNLVAQLQALEIDGLGVTGADLNLIPAQKRQHETIDFGFVGDFHIHEINKDRIQWLVAAGVVPVFCALTHDQNGMLLNTNADTMASGIASALTSMYQVSLYFCFEKSGVLLDIQKDIHIPELTYDAFQDLKQKNVIADGMIPKLDNAFNALHAGVSRVVIGNVQNLSQFEGTKLTDP